MAGNASQDQERSSYFHRKRNEAKRYAAKKISQIWLRWRLAQKWRRQRRPDTITAWATVAIFVATLVNAVAIGLQWSESRAADESSARAWVGSNAAYFDGTGGTIPRAGADFKIAIEYRNFGKEPATNAWKYVTIDLFSRDHWISGEAERVIGIFAQKCLDVTRSPEDSITFPSVATPYLLHLKSDMFLRSDHKPMVFTSDIGNGDQVLVTLGCFVYKTVGKIRHTSFCYYFDAKDIAAPTLNICMWGNRAD